MLHGRTLLGKGCVCFRIPSNVFCPVCAQLGRSLQKDIRMPEQ